jgi:hypothetical protein
MTDAERYQKDLELIFRELEEKEQLLRQAELMPYFEFIAKLARQKHVRELLQSLPPEKKLEVIDACWQAKLTHDAKKA